MKLRNKITQCLSLITFLVSFDAIADETELEIEHLLNAVGGSGCIFIRNGSSYNDEEAENHLRLKYVHGSRYATSAENFIERLASKSSISRNPYYIECEGKERVTSEDWLKQELSKYRAKLFVPESTQIAP